jgi:hypothetical protein
MYDSTVLGVQSPCVLRVQSLPTAAPSILRRLFAKLRLAEDSAAESIVAPLAGRRTGRCALEDEVILLHAVRFCRAVCLGGTDWQRITNYATNGLHPLGGTA